MKSQLNFIQCVLVVILLAVALTSQAEAGVTIYVDDSAAGFNDGSSWQNAYTDLQNALAAAAYDDEIRVGQGTYKPTTGSDRMISFQLIDGVSLCGGYAGFGEADPDAHDVVSFPTILSGNIATLDSNSDNSYHVVKTDISVGPTTILEGFIITGGNANGPAYSDRDGGGMYNHTSSPTVTNCIFTGNKASHGGGMYNFDGSLTMTNCTFSGNTANSGGGMFITNNSVAGNPTVMNCTFSGNMGNEGGAIRFFISPNTTVTNCILWGNTAPQINNNLAIITYSDVEGGTGQGWFGTGCIDSNPLFLDADGPDDTVGTADDDLRLAYNSPCLDTGDNTAPNLPRTDLSGNPRVFDGDGNGTAVVDMGVFEFQGPRVHNITQDLWYDTIQTSIYCANAGDEIEASPGIYAEAINFLGKPITVRSASGDPNDTVINGTGHYHVVQCVNSEGADTILESFTITGGNANGPAHSDRDGGGMYNHTSSPTVTNCIFTGNKASHGGGMLNVDGAPTVTGCTFKNNIASNGDLGGGGMYNHNSSPKVTLCIFMGNSGGPLGGGGMFNAAGSNPTMIHCTFSNNSAVVKGGGIYNWNGSMPILINCTFSGNSATDVGGGMYSFIGCSTTLTNCILWGNEPNEIFDDGTSSTTVTYSNVKGGYSGEGNIDADPLFVDADGLDNIPGTPDDDLRLAYNSPCLDAGNSTELWQAGIWKDLDGNLRYFDVYGVSDTGIGPVTYLDMGAYEFSCSGLPGDNNCDGVVNLLDLCILGNHWLQSINQE